MKDETEYKYKDLTRYYDNNTTMNLSNDEKMTEERVRNKVKELPPIELSYETFSSHKKTSSSSSSSSADLESYQVGLLIPKSKKYIAWFTFIGEEDVCILLELNREKQVVHHRVVPVMFDMKEPHLALGTFLYGSLVEHDQRTGCLQGKGSGTFVIEDILMYRSVSLRKLCFGTRLGILHHILAVSSSLPSETSLLRFMLPVMFPLKPGHCENNIGEFRCGYPVHHVQYRSFTHIIPYLNFPPNPSQLFSSTQRLNVPPPPPPLQNNNPRNISFGKELPSLTSLTSRYPSSSKRKYKEPAGRERAIFLTTADMQSDIYHLVHPSDWYMTDVAYIPNYKTSVMMNGLFRNIKENRNLDAMEDSDDEDDFYDIRYDKYVNLNKQLTMECMYHKKFRRWIPLRVIS